MSMKQGSLTGAAMTRAARSAGLSVFSGRWMVASM